MHNEHIFYMVKVIKGPAALAENAGITPSSWPVAGSSPSSSKDV